MTDWPTFPPHNGTPTSRQAAATVQPHCSGMRRTVLTCLAWSGPLTRAEIARTTDLKENTVNARVNEMLRAGWLEERGERDGRAILHLTSKGRVTLELVGR